jgi:hypothetical protein
MPSFGVTSTPFLCSKLIFNGHPFRAIAALLHDPRSCPLLHWTIIADVAPELWEVPFMTGRSASRI